MLLSIFFRGMPRNSAVAAKRVRAIAQQMSTKAASAETPQAALGEHLVKFASDQSMRKLILNRPKKQNTLTQPMLDLIHGKLKDWIASKLVGTVVLQGEGNHFCSGGDVNLVEELSRDEKTRIQASEFFRNEFQLDFELSLIPYFDKVSIAVMRGNTMGGGAGLAMPCQMRIATETTLFAMPETKIGYAPDVGATYFLSRLEGGLGTYLALTGNALSGREVQELGIATHYIASRKVPMALEAVASLDVHDIADWRVHELLKSYSDERTPDESPLLIQGRLRMALDNIFRHDTVEAIVADLKKATEGEDQAIAEWAQSTLDAIRCRSPTSLKVALKALRKGRTLSLARCLEMEYRISSSFCNQVTKDFGVGIDTVIRKKQRTGRPDWSTSEDLAEVTPEMLEPFFVDQPFHTAAPAINFTDKDRELEPDFYGWSTPADELPYELEIADYITGSASDSGNMAVTVEETLAHFTAKYPNKHGLEERLIDIILRKCKPDPSAEEDGPLALVWGTANSVGREMIEKSISDAADKSRRAGVRKELEETVSELNNEGHNQREESKKEREFNRPRRNNDFDA